MKPERLEFFGVKSYTNKTVVEFNRLLQNGLFGIFGNTGSGKSTILDCIFLALYGKLPKTNEREDYINVKTGKCYVKFSFSIVIDGVRKIYEVYREFQLKGERKNAPQPIAKLCEIDGDDRLPVEENASRVNAKLEEIIGLKIEDFEKCIVLPQGQFSAFVTLKRADRLDMVSGLFNLNKYGDTLTEKLKIKIKNFDEEIQFLTGNLSPFLEATKEGLEELDLKVKESKSLYKTENVKLSKIQEEFNDFKNDYERHKELLKCRKDLAELESKLGEQNGFKEIIRKIEPAKAYVETLKERTVLSGELSRDKTRLLSFESALLSAQDKLKDTQNKLTGAAEKTDRINAITGELANLNLLGSEQEENNKLIGQLEKLRILYSKENELYKSLILKLNTETEKLKNLENTEKYRDIDQRINREIDRLISVAQNTFVTEEVQFLLSLKESLTDTSLIDSRIKALNNLKSDNLTVEDCVKRLNELYLSLDEFNKLSASIRSSISDRKIEIERSKSQLEKIKENGGIIREQVDKTREKIFKLVGSETLETKILALQKEKTDIEKSLNDLKEAEKEHLETISEIRLKIVSLNSDIKNKSDAFTKLSEKIQDFEKEFADENEAKAIYSYYPRIAKLKEATESFDLNYLSLKAKVRELSDKLGNATYDEEEFTKRKQNLDDLQEKVGEFNINYNNLLKDYQNLSHKFEKRCTIEKELSVFSKNRKVVSELFDAVKNKRFLEYIAEEYLAEIALDAKSILLELTGGRFGLVYQGDFFVEDFIYPDGGKRRVDAVSGGELFLVSLSLALALSKCIYAKSSRPMEFFFLDEGFGSLDKELIEVVVDCLYKLKNSSFSIGIISHVEALKERLPVRISVTGAKDGCGSKVNITA